MAKAKKSKKKTLIISLGVVVLLLAAVLAGGLLFINRASQGYASGMKALKACDFQTAHQNFKAAEMSDSLGELVSTDPDYAYHINLAKAAYHSGDKAAAKHHAEKGLEALPLEGDPNYAKAQVEVTALLEIKHDHYVGYCYRPTDDEAVKQPKKMDFEGR